MSEASEPLAGRRILVIEDEYLIAMELKRWLREAGVAVIGPVPSVDEALDLIEDGATLDAAVLDVDLGSGDTSYPVADRPAELGVPFLFATGSVRVRSHPDYGGRPRLDKPITGAELLVAIETLIAGPPA